MTTTLPAPILQRPSFLALWAFYLAIIGCSDAPSAPAQPDAGADSAVDEHLEPLLNELFTEYNHLLEVNCPCHVEMGAYESVEACKMWQEPRGDWVACVSGAVSESDRPEATDFFGCVAGLVESNAECLSAKACDPYERTECDVSPLECVGDHQEFALRVAMKCPDLSLLPRLSAN